MSDKRPHKGKTIRKSISNYTVIDLETTGRYINSCEIIEIAAAKVRNGKIIDTFSCLVQPTKAVPRAIEMLTGITNEMLIHAPFIEDVIYDFIEFIGKDTVIGHNISSFDCNIIYDLCEGFGMEPFNNTILDTYHYARCCDIDVPNYKLTTLTSHFGVEHDSAHRALADCIANHECYEMLKTLYTGCYDSSTKSPSTPLFHKKYSDATMSLQMLSGIVEGVICDGILSDEEIRFLKKWTDDNQCLAGNFPFDIISATILDILEDNIITADERALLFNILTDYSNPVENCSEKNTETICIQDKQVVLTGEFNYGEKSEVTKTLENLGATVKNSVSGKTDYVIVGSKGSDNWSCGNYGSKVKKALELQEKGNSIKIVKEEDFFKCMKVPV